MGAKPQKVWAPVMQKLLIIFKKKIKVHVRIHGNILANCADVKIAVKDPQSFSERFCFSKISFRCFLRENNIKWLEQCFPRIAFFNGDVKKLKEVGVGCQDQLFIKEFFLSLVVLVRYAIVVIGPAHSYDRLDFRKVPLYYFTKRIRNYGIVNGIRRIFTFQGYFV